MTRRHLLREWGTAPIWAGLWLGVFSFPAFGQPLEVAVTIAPQAWLVEQIGGNRVQVTTLVAPGDSPETFLPSDQQASRLLRSAVYFRIGAGGERGAWFDVLKRSGRVEIVDLRDGIELLPLPRHADGTGHHTHNHRFAQDGVRSQIQPHSIDVGPPTEMDPHIWLSPRRLRHMATTIATTLERLDRGGEAVYRSHLATLEDRLDQLDHEMQSKLGALTGRAFMIFHPSWGYLASDYGLRQLAVEIEGKEPSDAETAELLHIARHESLSVIFVQPQIRGRSAEILAEAIGGRVVVLDPLVADVATNLSHAADQIAAALRPTSRESPGLIQDISDNPFLVPGLVAGLLAGLACGLIGPYVLTRRIVFLGGAIAHIAVGGLGASIYLRHFYSESFAWLQPIHGAALVSVLAAFVLARLEPVIGRKTAASPVPMDTVIGALWATGMAVGILLVKLTPGYNSDLMSYLFGNLTFVDWADVRLMLTLVAVLFVTVILYQKRFLALCLDAEQMQLQGVKAKNTSAVLLVLVALTVIVLTQVVGLILVVALLSLPAATAALFARRLPSMILLSAVLAATLTTVPRIAVYGTRISPEPAIVLAAGFIFLLASSQRWRRALTERP